jgi:hypothetical protein
MARTTSPPPLQVTIRAFAKFENLYEYTVIPSLLVKSGFNRYNVKNFATKSHIPNVGFDASGSEGFFYKMTRDA